MRLREEHSTLLSRHFRTVFLVMGTGWALVLLGDDGGSVEHASTLWVCVKHIQSGSCLCHEMGSTLRVLALFVNPVPLFSRSR